VNKAFKIAAILLAGLIGGCGSDDSTAPADSNIVGAGIFSSGLAVCCISVDESSHDEQAPQVAFNGTTYLVVYEEGNANRNIIGAVISSSGTSHVNIAVSSKNDQAPRVASDGTNFLVVYQEVRTGNNHSIIGKRVDSNGNVLDPDGILIDATDDNTAPAVAFGGGKYLVVYQRGATPSTSDHNIIGKLVDTSGGLGSEIQIDTSASDDLAPAAAFGAGKYLVVYQRDATTINPDHNIIGKQVDTSENVGSEIPIDTTVLDDIAPSVASNGTDYLVAYERVFSTHDDIRGAVVDGTGTTITPFGIDTSLTTDDRAPAVASNGSIYLVAYQRVLSKDNDIQEAIIDTTGIPSVTLNPIDTSNSDYVAPAVASDGSNYFVVFEEVF